MNKTLLGTLFFLGSSCLGYAEIQTASSLEPIQQDILHSPIDTLVLLDVGGTLLEYPDAVLFPSNEGWKYHWFQTHCPGISREEKIALDRIILGTLENWKLLDPQWPEVIVQAQTHGAKVVAFTKVAMDPSQTGTRAQILRALGIPFQNDLPELSNGQSYEYSQGVIETEYQLKGPVLKEVLSCLKTCPKKIIFVDDRMNQIKSVNDACSELEIPCTAFHYAPITKNLPLNEIIADYQLSTLVHERRWVHEDEARSEMDSDWPIGAKIHFEEESGPDYIGTKEIHQLIKNLLDRLIPIKTDQCSSNAKILLKNRYNEMIMTHYEEEYRPGVGEELHATLLYDQPRGFCGSETLKQVCPNLFGTCDFPPSMKSLAKEYSSIIKPESRFKISEAVFTENDTGSAFVMLKLLFDENENICKNGKPVSAGLHMTLIHSKDSILEEHGAGNLLVESINSSLKNKTLKVSNKNGVADLEFGRPGFSLRMRAEKYISVKDL